MRNETLWVSNGSTKLLHQHHNPNPVPPKKLHACFQKPNASRSDLYRMAEVNLGLCTNFRNGFVSRISYSFTSATSTIAIIYIFCIENTVIITKTSRAPGHCKGCDRQNREHKTTAMVIEYSLSLLSKSQKQKLDYWITGSKQ